MLIQKEHSGKKIHGSELFAFASVITHSGDIHRIRNRDIILAFPGMLHIAKEQILRDLNAMERLLIFKAGKPRHGLFFLHQLHALAGNGIENGGIHIFDVILVPIIVLFLALFRLLGILPLKHIAEPGKCDGAGVEHLCHICNLDKERIGFFLFHASPQILQLLHHFFLVH